MGSFFSSYFVSSLHHSWASGRENKEEEAELALCAIREFLPRVVVDGLGSTACNTNQSYAFSALSRNWTVLSYVPLRSPGIGYFLF